MSLSWIAVLKIPLTVHEEGHITPDGPHLLHIMLRLCVVVNRSLLREKAKEDEENDRKELNQSRKELLPWSARSSMLLLLLLLLLLALTRWGATKMSPENSSIRIQSTKKDVEQLLGIKLLGICRAPPAAHPSSMILWPC